MGTGQLLLDDEGDGPRALTLRYNVDDEFVVLSDKPVGSPRAKTYLVKVSTRSPIV